MEGGTQIDSFFQTHKISILMGVVGVVLLVGGAITTNSFSGTKRSSIAKVQGTSTVSIIKVDVSGAVNNPGVYDLTTELRVEDAIKAAGGVSMDADPEYINKSLNLAQKVSDGMKIYIPFQGEDTGIFSGNSQQKAVSINQGGLSELDSLPGVGLVTAQKIIDNRPYSTVEELLTKKAVSKAIYEKIKVKISI